MSLLATTYGYVVLLLTCQRGRWIRARRMYLFVTREPVVTPSRCKGARVLHTTRCSYQHNLADSALQDATAATLGYLKLPVS